MTVFRKSWLLLMLTAVLSLGITGAAWAGPRGMGGACGMGPGMEQDGGMGMGHHGRGMGYSQMTPDQAAKAFDLRQKFMNETADLRKQMAVKRAELGELWRAKDPDKAKIAAKQKEINAVRDQLQEKGTSFKVDMQKEFPTLAGGSGCPQMGGGKGPGGCPMVPPAPEGAKK